MQCSGRLCVIKKKQISIEKREKENLFKFIYRGVFAIVHNGYVICGGYNSKVHSIHAV